MGQAPEGEDGERGVIINTTSQAIELGQIGQAAYSASKGGVEAMTVPIARELARLGIRVNTIVPGLVSTNMIRVESLADQPNAPLRELPEGLEDAAARHYVFPRRQGHASEYASLALEIIKNPMLNGGSFPLDGAMRFGPKW
jgi:NAD(P)-dependent dehydrogenase (short-subunit alcohol dehydrogenase family)